MSFGKSSLRMATDFNLKALLPEFSALYCNCTREKKAFVRARFCYIRDPFMENLLAGIFVCESMQVMQNHEDTGSLAHVDPNEV